LGNLKTELSNLATENEKIRADYAALLESSTHVTNKLRQEVQELRSQLEQERADREEVEAELADLKQNSTTASELPEPEHIEFLKRLVAKKDPLIASDLWQEIERLKESHRRLRLKMGAERRESIEKTSDLEDWVKGLTRRVEEKQARLDELEAQLEAERADREEIENELSDLKQKSATANKDLPDATDVKHESARTSDLSDKAAKVVSFFRPLLNKKAPTNLLAKVEEILEES
jgi:DNA repair exonuclease SbcCD ATPase subunit